MIVFYFCTWLLARKDAKRKEVLALLRAMREVSFVNPPWEDLRRCLIFKRVPNDLAPFTTCGKILAHSRQQVTELVFENTLASISVCSKLV